MNKNSAVFVTSDFVYYEFRDDNNALFYTCYARENDGFREISSGSADSAAPEAAAVLDELILDIGDPSFEMWEVPVYVDSNTSVTDLESWYIRQIIAKSIRGMSVPVHMERLYKAGTSYLLVSCEADEGWYFSFYAKDSEGILRLKDGGYIEGRITDPIDEIAHTAARRLFINDPLEKAGISTDQLSDWVVDKEDMEYRGIKVFLSPELKANGIDCIPPETIDELKRIVDERLSMPILLKYDHEQGYQMIFTGASEIHDKACRVIQLPDGTAGSLYFDPSISDETISEYDDDWAREIWLQDIHISIRGEKYVLESE